MSYLASVASLRWIRAEFQEERASAPLRLWAAIREGVAWLWRQPVMRFIAFLTGGLMAFSMGYSLIVIVIAKDLHASNAAIGILFGAGGLGGILGALLADFANKRFRFGQIMVVTTWLWGLEWLLCCRPCWPSPCRTLPWQWSPLSIARCGARLTPPPENRRWRNCRRRR